MNVCAYDPVGFGRGAGDPAGQVRERFPCVPGTGIKGTIEGKAARRFPVLPFHCAVVYAVRGYAGRSPCFEPSRGEARASEKQAQSQGGFLAEPSFPRVILADKDCSFHKSAGG